jgi:hypothetical protein
VWQLSNDTLSALKNYLVYKENTGLLFYQGIPGLSQQRGDFCTWEYIYEFNTYWSTFHDLIYPGFKQLCRDYGLNHRLTGYWLTTEGRMRRIAENSSIKTSDMVRMVIMVWALSEG